ncbi:MAG: MCE family protein [Gordonia sp. (in: high G+C Gram-positive bacteria)]|uniref:MCE family protein n=1 Tax=Gordonia sp. (in: high G+C Gram-positive bacteria) TaxID=84139 RepID=UPI0039E3E1B6
MSAALKRRLSGLLFFVVIISLVLLSIAIFLGKFKSETNVTLKTASAGNALADGADVKARGVVVGTVKKVTVSDGGQVQVEMGIKPDIAKELPGNTTARVLPKTLFGERFVALQIPDSPSDGTLASAKNIFEDPSGNAPEVEDLFDALTPVIKAIPPQDLNVTLTAISQAIGGKGKQLATTIDQLNDIFSAVNANMPQLQGTLEGLASFSQTYSEALPTIIDGLDNLRVTNRTIVGQQDDLRNLISTLGGASDQTTQFLQTNKTDLLHLAVDSETLLVQLARQSPTFGCMFHNFATIVPKAEKIVGKGTKNPGVRVNLQFVNPRGRYLPNQDEPRMWWTDPPARCYQPATNGRPFPQYPGGGVPDGSYQPPSRNAGPKNWPDLPQPDFSATPSGSGMTDRTDQMKLIYGANNGQYPADVPTWVTYTGQGALKDAEVNLK